MECLFQELKKEKYTNVLLVDRLKIMAKVDRPIDVVRLQIELVIVCYILYLEGH